MLDGLMEPGTEVEREAPGQDDVPGEARVGYTIVVPDVLQQTALRHAIAKLTVAPVSAEGLRAQLRECLAEVCRAVGDTDALADHVETIARFEELNRAIIIGGEAEQAATEELIKLAGRISQIETMVARHHDGYRELVADRRAWAEYGAIEAVRMFTRGARNLELGPVNGAGLSMAQLAKIERRGDMEWLSGQIYGLLAADPDTEKK